MHLFHGSTEIVAKPAILENQRLLDFGKGFYLTSNKQQAERWAFIKQKRVQDNGKAYVSIYSFDQNTITNPDIVTKEFQNPNEEWLDFVVKNRNEYFNHGFDIVKGPVANDTLYQTLSLYENNILSKQETIARLKVHPLYNQIAITSKKALKLLMFKESYEVK